MLTTAALPSRRETLRGTVWRVSQFSPTRIKQRAVRILKQPTSAPKPFHASRLRPFASLGQHPKIPTPPLDPSRVPYQPFVYHGMQIHHATRLMREVCALRHLSINTEKSYTHWLGRYASFL